MMGAIDNKVKYRRQFLPIAKKMMQDGAVLQDLADKFDVCLGTIRKWFQTHPEFKVAVLTGKDEFDVEVLEPLLLQAITPHDEEEVTTVDEAGKLEKTTKKIKKMVTNPALMMKWLSLRGGERWKDVQKFEIEGSEGQEDRLRQAMVEQAAKIKAEMTGENTKEKLF